MQNNKDSRYIGLNFPPSVYWDESAKYHKNVQKFVIHSISPKTVAGEVDITITTEKKLREFIQLQQAYTDPNHPEFIPFLKQLIADEVKIVNNYPFYQSGSRTTNYTYLELIIKVSNAEWTQTVPTELMGSQGSGEEDDAEVGQTRTWQQWNRFAQHLGSEEAAPIHSNDTHKFLVCYPYAALPQLTHEHYQALFEKLDLNDRNTFDLLTQSEYEAQRQADLELQA